MDEPLPTAIWQHFPPGAKEAAIAASYLLSDRQLYPRPRADDCCPLGLALRWCVDHGGWRLPARLYGFPFLAPDSETVAGVVVRNRPEADLVLVRAQAAAFIERFDAGKIPDLTVIR